jgi:hypothetical protein
VPEPAALVGLGLAPSHVLRASAPKPISATLALAHDTASSGTPVVALDISPYFLFGGGQRSLQSYRKMNVGGRLMRVLTKTLLSLGAAWDPADPGAPRVALGLRTTFHDPHDPIGGSRLPETIDSALAAHGIKPGSNVEEVGDLGVDLRRQYATARQVMRSRCCIQIAGGWGMAGRLGGAEFTGDSLDHIRHTLWVTTQYTFGPRYDLLTTGQLWNGLGDDTHWRLGAAVQRKTEWVDFAGELYFDSADDRLHPGGWIEGRVVRGLRAGASLTTETDPSGGPVQLKVRTLIRWYMAQGG